MGIKFNMLPGVFAGSLTNFASYRQLIRRPLRETLVYLAILITVPVLLFSGVQLYMLNRLLVEIMTAMEGHLPDIRIEKGVVQMEGETFLFEKENEYSRQD